MIHKYFQSISLPITSAVKQLVNHPDFLKKVELGNAKDEKEGQICS